VGAAWQQKRCAAARWSGAGVRCGEAVTSVSKWGFLSIRILSWGRDGGENVEGSRLIAYWARSLRRPKNRGVRMHMLGQTP
jgi:hypothetical protein